MDDLDAIIADLTAENLALRSLVTGFLVEMIRRGQIGIVSNAFAYARNPLEGIARKVRPAKETRERAGEIVQQLYDEVLGMGSEENEPESE